MLQNNDHSLAVTGHDPSHDSHVDVIHEQDPFKDYVIHCTQEEASLPPLTPYEVWISDVRIEIPRSAPKRIRVIFEIGVWYPGMAHPQSTVWLTNPCSAGDSIWNTGLIVGLKKQSSGATVYDLHSIKRLPLHHVSQTHKCTVYSSSTISDSIFAVGTITPIVANRLVANENRVTLEAPADVVNNGRAEDRFQISIRSMNSNGHLGETENPSLFGNSSGGQGVLTCTTIIQNALQVRTSPGISECRDLKLRKDLRWLSELCCRKCLISDDTLSESTKILEQLSVLMDEYKLLGGFSKTFAMVIPLRGSHAPELIFSSARGRSAAH